MLQIKKTIKVDKKLTKQKECTSNNPTKCFPFKIEIYLAN